MDISELRRITGLSEASIMQALRTLLPPEEKEKKQKKEKECVSYMQIERTTTCEHCKASWVDLIHLQQKETISALQKDGTVRTIYALNIVKEPVKLRSYTASCKYCPTAIKALPREDLEERYMTILKLIPIDKVRDINRREVK